MSEQTDKPGGTQSALPGTRFLKLLPTAICCAFIGHCLGLGDNGINWELCTIGGGAGFIIGAIIGVFEQRRGREPKAR
jgi:hypothetical protein